MSASTVSVSAQVGEVRLRLTELLPQLRLRALKLCRDRDLADDLLQETALRALSFEASYKNDTNLKAWLYKSVQRVRHALSPPRRAGRFMAEHAADPNLWCGSREPTARTKA